MPKTCLPGQCMEKGSEKGQDLYTFPNHLDLNECLPQRSLCLTQVLQIHLSYAWIWEVKYVIPYLDMRENGKWDYLSQAFTNLIGTDAPLGLQGKGLCWKSILECRSTNKWLHWRPIMWVRLPMPAQWTQPMSIAPLTESYITCRKQNLNMLVV